jgi:hydrogenase maturation protease
MTAPKILIACIGNIFLGDDAFGVEVARLLAKRSLDDRVRLVDFGIRGLDLVYALLEDWQAVIFVDAAPRGGEPGALYVIEPDLAEIVAGSPSSLALDAHQMDPVRVLRLAAGMGAKLPKLLIVGCEPAPLEGDDLQGGLSPAVAAAVAPAGELVESLLAEILAGAMNPPVEPAEAIATIS